MDTVSKGPLLGKARKMAVEEVHRMPSFSQSGDGIAGVPVSGTQRHQAAGRYTTRSMDTRVARGRRRGLTLLGDCHDAVAR